MVTYTNTSSISRLYIPIYIYQSHVYIYVQTLSKLHGSKPHIYIYINIPSLHVYNIYLSIYVYQSHGYILNTPLISCLYIQTLPKSHSYIYKHSFNLSFINTYIYVAKGAQHMLLKG